MRCIGRSLTNMKCDVSSGSAGLELAAGKDGKAVDSQTGHYQVKYIPSAVLKSGALFYEKATGPLKG